METETKSAWASKTVLGNLCLASACELFPGFGHWVSLHPETYILITAFVNIILRHFTSEGVHWGKKNVN